jgi:uncharacterized GH25 family protein
MRTVQRLLSVFIAFACLPLQAAITGSVMNADGQAIAGAKVSIFEPETLAAHRERLMSKTPERKPLATTTVDSNGNFRIEPPKEKAVPAVDLRVDAAGYAPEATRAMSDDEAGALVLTRAEAKSGTVTANGKAVAGATVVWASTAEAVAVTDANGHYSVPDPARWAGRVMIFHPDYARFDQGSAFNSSRRDMNFTLTPGVKVSGKVVGENGTTGVADATIDIDGWVSGKSSADGTFTIEHAPKSWQEVRAVSGSRIAMRANGGALTLKLAKGATVTGSLRDIKTQLPLTGGEVQVYTGGPGRFGIGPGGGATAFMSAPVDAKGNFTLGPLAPGSYNLNANRPNYEIPGATVSLTAGQSQSKAMFGTQLARVSGIVIDEDKRPVAAARIAAQRAGRVDPMMMLVNRQSIGRVSFSGPDGHFVARVIELDSDVHINAIKKGYPATKSSVMRLTAGEKKSGVTLVIPRGIALTGRVTDKNGKPLSGVSVDPAASESDNPFGGQIRRAVMRNNSARDEDAVTTGNDGTFTIRLKEGKYDITFKRDGFSAKTLRAQNVAAGEKPVEVVLEPGVEISGRVVRGGAGVEGVNVNILSPDASGSAVTGPDGSFSITDLTPGQMMLMANKPDAMIQEMRPVTAPARDLLIEVPVGGRITGHVVDRATHRPITSFQAGISTSRGGGGMMVMTPPITKPFTSDDGSFTLENIKPGPTQVVAMAPGYTTGRAATVEVEDGKTVSDIEVPLEAGAKLVGKVTDSSGSPLSGVTIRPEMMGGNAARVMRFDALDQMATTDPSGEYSLDSIEPGEHTFVFSRSGFVDESKSITLAGGKDNRLDVVLGSGIRVGGQVVTEGGVPVADATVHASSAAGSNREAHSDASGNFQLEGLTPGHYTFTAIKTGLANGILRDVDVATQNNVRITMKSGGTISGTVTGLQPQDLEHTTVFAQGPNGSASAPVDSAGAYRIEGAPSGTVRVNARTGQIFGGSARSTTPKTVELDAGGSAQVDIEFKSDTVIRGRVTQNNQPVAQANVNFFPRQGKTQTNASTTSDANGNYEISGLEDGPYNVQVVDMKNLVPFSTTYDVHGSGNFDIDVRTSSLHGRVLDATTGQPIEGAEVDVHPQSNDGAFFGTRTALTDSSGTFMLDSVARGSYQVSADKQGYGRESRNLSISDSPGEVELKLNPTAGVTVKVIDGRDGTPLGASVRVTDMSGQAVSGGDVPFRLGSGGSAEPIRLSLAPGTYRMTVSAMGYAQQTLTISSPSTQTVALTPGGTLIIHSKSSTPLRARLIDSSGTPYGYNPFTGGAFRIVESPGTTTLQNIAAGHYRLDVLDANDQVIKSMDVDIVEGRAAEYQV